MQGHRILEGYLSTAVTGCRSATEDVARSSGQTPQACRERLHTLWGCKQGESVGLTAFDRLLTY